MCLHCVNYAVDGGFAGREDFLFLEAMFSFFKVLVTGFEERKIVLFLREV